MRPSGVTLNAMSAIKIETTVDEATAQAIPALRPLLGRRIELTASQTDAAPAALAARKMSFETLLAQRVNAPSGTKPLTEEDIRRAIIQGALDVNV